MRKNNQPKLWEIHEMPEKKGKRQEATFSQQQYEDFLREQTHQLKKLLQNFKYSRKLVNLSNTTSSWQTPSIKQPYQPRVPKVLTTFSVPTSQTLELNTFDLKGLTSQHFQRPKRRYATLLEKVSQPMNERQFILPEFYRQRRRQIEESLYIGGKSYQSERQTTAKSTATTRRQPHGRELSQRLRMSLRKHNKDRYVCTPSR